MSGPPSESPATSVRVAPIMWRMFSWSFGSALAFGVAFYLFCLKTGPNNWELNALFWLLFIGNFALMVRWFRGALRRAGYPLSFTIHMAQWQMTAAYGAALIGTIVLTDFVDRWTGSRVLEGLVALCFVPLAFILSTRSFALQPEPKPQEAGLLRWIVIMRFALPVIFGINLALQLLRHHYYDAESEIFSDWTIAGYFVVLVTLPINGYFLRQRYLRARALGAPLARATSM